jgi:hypothetical protein
MGSLPNQPVPFKNTPSSFSSPFERTQCKSPCLSKSPVYTFPVSQTIQLRLHAPGDLGKFRLPAGVQQRLSQLLDRQDQGFPLTAAERLEAEGLVDLSEMLSLLKLRSSHPQPVAA